jgi:hypothetical protein
VIGPQSETAQNPWSLGLQEIALFVSRSVSDRGAACGRSYAEGGSKTQSPWNPSQAANAQGN